MGKNASTLQVYFKMQFLKALKDMYLGWSLTIEEASNHNPTTQPCQKLSRTKKTSCIGHFLILQPKFMKYFLKWKRGNLL
jgi:hypothetical protein